jgi:energy-coupling factor transport system permease protein
MPLERLTYHPGDSFLHRLHPLSKAAWLIFGTVAVFAVRSPWAVVAVVGLLLLGFPLAGVRLSRVRGARLFVSTALLLGLLQVLFVREGAVLLQLGPLAVTSGGVQAGIYVAGRFLSVILLSYLFVLTTEPNDLAYALMRAGLPYRYGFALITALRLVPVFEQEGQIVYNAQLARGVRYDVKSPRRFLTLARQFVLPLLVSALGKVDALAVSMEGRCFGKHPARTFLREVRATWRDGVAVGALVAGILAIGTWILNLGGS